MGPSLSVATTTLQWVKQSSNLSGMVPVQHHQPTQTGRCQVWPKAPLDCHVVADAGTAARFCRHQTPLRNLWRLWWRASTCLYKSPWSVGKERWGRKGANRKWHVNITWLHQTYPFFFTGGPDTMPHTCESPLCLHSHLQVISIQIQLRERTWSF